MKMKIFKLCNTAWFTNLKKPTNKKKLTLGKKYNPSEYPKYDNYDAINVNKIKDIPIDYDGYMGVPLTFLKYVNNDFKIIGMTYSNDRNPDIELIRTDSKKRHNPFINNKELYNRIIIKRK